MYEPILNSVLVQIDDKDGEWGGGNDDSMLGASYSKGTVIEVATMVKEQTHPGVDEGIFDQIYQLKGKKVMWNEGTEAGTVFEFDDKKFGLIYWWDLRAVLVGKD